MAEYVLNRNELSQYSLLRSQVLKLDRRISEAQNEINEINQYNMSISPVLTGMPSGNERRDRIADFIIRLENDRQRLNAAIASFEAEKEAVMYRLKKIREAVNDIPNEQLKEIIELHYIEGHSFRDIADKVYLSESAVYKRINRFLRCGSKNSRESG